MRRIGGSQDETNSVHREWRISPGHDSDLRAHHGQGLSHPFFAMHSILAAATGMLSLIGAYFLLTNFGSG